MEIVCHYSELYDVREEECGYSGLLIANAL